MKPDNSCATEPGQLVCSRHAVKRALDNVTGDMAERRILQNCALNPRGQACTTATFAFAGNSIIGAAAGAPRFRMLRQEPPDRDRLSAPGQLPGQQEFSRTNDFRLFVPLSRCPGPPKVVKAESMISFPIRQSRCYRCAAGAVGRYRAKVSLGRPQQCPKAAPISNPKGTAKPLCTNGLMSIVPLFGCRGRGRWDSVSGISGGKSDQNITVWPNERAPSKAGAISRWKSGLGKA